MPTTHETNQQGVTQQKQTSPVPRPTPAPGRKMSFEEALETVVREDRELLRRLAK